MKSILFYRSFIALFLVFVCSLVSVPGYAASDLASEPQQLDSININSANGEQMAEGLDGVGLKKAEAIVSYREQHGAFTSLEQLAEVKGIGEKIVAKNKAKLTL